ncbi:MAG: hypothetical protein ACYTG7_07735 [Planctomycetota bacterium]
MVISTRILHDNEEFLVQDKNASSTSRQITFLARPHFAACNGSESCNLHQMIKTNHGEWIPIAKWNKKAGLELLTDRSDRLTSTLKSILGKYLETGGGKSAAGRRKRYYYIEKDGEPVYSLSHSHPYGLAIRICSSMKLARELLDSERGDKIRQTDNLKDFLTKAADDGYAGAILDDEAPIYFCLTRSDHMVFLKLSIDENEEEVQEYLLNNEGAWDIYEGEQEIDFFLDQESCDETMVKHLGEIPFFGHSQIKSLWTIEVAEKSGSPYVLSEKDNPFPGVPGARVVILFQERRNAMEFILERGLLRCEAVLVDDIRSFLKIARKKELSVCLEPFNHRASSGTLWLNENEMILDSFSGFWILDDDWTFTRA